MLTIGVSIADRRQMVAEAIPSILRRPSTTSGGQASESSRSSMSAAISARMSSRAETGSSRAELDEGLPLGTESVYMLIFSLSGLSPDDS